MLQKMVLTLDDFQLGYNFDANVPLPLPHNVKCPMPVTTADVLMVSFD